MPSVSAKQAKLMRAAAHNKAFADRAGIKQSVAKDFVAADKSEPKSDKSRIAKRYK